MFLWYADSKSGQYYLKKIYERILKMEEEITKTINDSKVEQIHLLMPTHINGFGRLFGGQLLAWIDEVAGIVAKRHSESIAITAAIDNLQFKEGAHVNDTIVLIGYLTYVGNTSMEVRVDTYVENLHGDRHPINRAFLTMVAIDENEKPKRVPRLRLTNVSEEAEWEAAKKRIELRKQRHAEGF